MAIAFRMEELLGFVVKYETTGYRLVLTVVKNRVYLELRLGETFKFMYSFMYLLFIHLVYK